MMNNRTVSAIIVAAGSSSRMGADKMLLPIDGVPCIVRTLSAFESSAVTDEVILVTSGDKTGLMKEYKEKYGLAKLSAVVEGGDCRQRSAANGFAAVRPDCAFVAVHDGARPLVTPEIIDKTIEEAARYGAAIAACPEKNTVKLVGADGFVEKTLDRRMLYAAVTPQVFSYEIYKKMTEELSSRFSEFTDDSSMAEVLGIRVRIVDCMPENIKITTPGDIPVAENILMGLKKRSQSRMI